MRDDDTQAQETRTVATARSDCYARMNETSDNPAGQMLRPAVAVAPEHDGGLFVDRAELARRLCVHERTVRRMVERGELPKPCLSAGGRPRWLWSYVVDYCRRQHENTVKLDRRMRRELT